MTRVAAALVLLLALAGCGDDEPLPLTVSAAASLRDSLTQYSEPFDARLTFGGSDQLAAGIREGERPDVFAAADADLVTRLHAEGLVDVPVAFATNEVVLAVPTRSEVGELADVARAGVRLVVGSAGSPIGRYSRRLLAELPRAARENVSSEEPDVAGVLGALRAGAADAGFVYRTDMAAGGDGLRPIELPPELQPEISYAAAVVTGSERAGEAQAYVDGLPGAPALSSAGFGPP